MNESAGPTLAIPKACITAWTQESTLQPQVPYSTSSQFSRNPCSKRAAGKGAAYR